MNSWAVQIYLGWVTGPLDRALALPRRTEVFTTEFPSYVGWSHGAKWCLGGAPGGLQNVVKQLLQHDIRLSDAQRLKDSYFNHTHHWRANNNTRLTPNLRSSWFNVEETHRSGSPDEDIANNLMGVARVLPVFRDIIDFSWQGGLGSKLRLFAKKVCTLFQVEADIPGLAGTGTPFSCALIDAFQSGVACDVHEGESDLIAGNSAQAQQEKTCDQYDWWKARTNKMFNQFPAETCHAHKTTLQSFDRNHTFKAFKWHQPGIILPLAMEDMLFRNESNQTVSLPRAVPAQVRDAELLTYLALYRGLRRIYEIREEFENCQGGPNNKLVSSNGKFVMSSAIEHLLSSNDLIPGWRTSGLINLAQVSRKSAEQVAVGIESPREQKNLPDDISFLPPMYIPDLIRDLLPSRYTSLTNPLMARPAYMHWPSLSEIWGIRPRGHSTTVQNTRTFWEQIDGTTRNAVKTVWRDIKALVNDPVNVYKAIGDLLTAISLPYMQETSVDVMRSAWSTWSPRKILESAADLLKITRAADFGKESQLVPPTHDHPIVSPFLFISARRDEPCEISVGVRGTASFNEWLLDFTAWMAPDPVLGHSHKGVQLLTATIWPTLRVFLEEHSEKHNCTCARTRVIFYGHSLGAAVAQQLALRMALLYTNPHTLGRENLVTVPYIERRTCDIQVDAILFAPVRQLDIDGIELFSRVINGRILIDVNDPLTYIPCQNEYWPRCGRGHMSPGGVGSDFFPDHTAVVWLDVDFPKLNQFNTGPETMPQDVGDSRTLVSRLITTMLPPAIHKNLPTGENIKAAHICSHSCALSTACMGTPDSAFRWWCEDCPVSSG